MKHLLSTIFILLFSIVFYSCNKEDTSAGLTSEEASVAISSNVNKISADIIEMAESDGINGMIDLIESYIFTAREDDAGDVKLQISEIFQDFVTGPFAEVADDEIESFDDIKGLYTWNFETEMFDKSASAFFIVQFPTDDSSTNNAEFKIAKLELEEITDEYDDGYVDEYLVPSLIEAQLKIDEKVAISLNLSVDWSSDRYPNLANIALVVEPFTLTVGFDDLQTKSSSLLVMLKMNDEDILGIDVDMEFETELKEYLTVLEGYILYNNLRVKGRASDSEYNEDINESVDIEILIDEEKAGDLVFIGDDEVPYIRYLDGTTEEVEILFEEAIEEIEEAIERIENASEATVED
ncbi:MAG: hypothetical protein OXH57_07170 [Ekhidna sp.]|nr:hypothetical protein [Ekhidna sp.]